MGTTGPRSRSSPWAAGAGALAVAIGAGAALAPPAQAVSRVAAERAAVRALNVRPSDVVVVFGLGRPLRARQSVSTAGPQNLGNAPPTARQRRALRPLGRQAWLFWADWVPGAAFTHPSTMVLVDDRTGRVLRCEGMGFYPLIDGRRPPFLRSNAAYVSRRHRVLDQPRNALVANRPPATGRAPPSRAMAGRSGGPPTPCSPRSGT